MEIQKSPGQKFWKIVRIAGKAISNQYYHSCRSDGINASFVSPREYEFSCSNTSKYKNRHYQTEELKVMRRAFEILESPEQHQVDKDAEEFIKKFYKDLKKQKRIAAALGSPSPYHQFMG